MSLYLKRYLSGILLFFVVVLLAGQLSTIKFLNINLKMTASVLDLVSANNAKPVYGYAWNDNVGWINFGSEGTTTEGQVYLSGNKLYGYAWGENIGWISMNCANDNTCADNGGIDYWVTQNNNDGVLTGYAWGENIGWINFNPGQGGGVTVDTNTVSPNDFHGYAWGENIGWIAFNSADLVGSSPFKVSTSWTKPPAGSNMRVTSVVIDPKNIALHPGETAQFNATVYTTGTRNPISKTIRWEMVDNNGGVIDSGGVFTASSTEGTYQVKVISNDDETKYATANVTITKAPIPIVIGKISPSAPTVYANSTTTFRTTVTGTTSDDVIWSIKEGTIGGHISPSTGLFSATGTPGVYTIVATAAASSSVSTSTKVKIITPPPMISISQEGNIFWPNKIVNFTANVTGTTSTDVTWSIKEGLEGGDISSSTGRYVATSTTGGTYTIIATLNSDPAISSSKRIEIVDDKPLFTIAPQSTTTFTNKSVNFLATLLDSPTRKVTWVVADEAGGEINELGLYTAPSMAGIFHIIAHPLITSPGDTTLNQLSSVATISVRLSPKIEEATSTATTTTATTTNTGNDTNNTDSNSDQTVVGGQNPGQGPTGGGSIFSPAGNSVNYPGSSNNRSGNQSTSTASTTAVSRAITDIQNVVIENIAVLGTTTQAVVKKVSEAVNSPVGSIVTKTVTTAGVVGGGIAVTSAVALNPMVASEIFLVPFRLWTLLLGVLGLRRKNKPWGTVYDSVTKQPLDPAYVLLQDENGKEVSMSITDLDGRYGFLTAPGKYKIVANKTNYIFPSKKLAGKASDEIYHDLYFGEDLNIVGNNVVLYKNIPLDPEKFDWNEFMKTQKGLTKFYSRRDRIVTAVTNWFFRIGLLISLVSLVFAPKPYNAIIFGFYILLVLLRKFGLGQKTNGNITEKASGNPLSFAIIRIMAPELNVEISSKVADRLGRYYCLVPKGKYYLIIEKKNADESYTPVFTSPVFETKNGIINQNFKI
ncbi:MAG: hypothetical protein WCO10_02795 [bacterium]